MDSFNVEYEDLFGDEDADNEVSRVADLNTNPASPYATQDQANDAAADLQIQQKLKEIANAVVKKRALKPQPKLDPSRLTGERGLAVLPKLAKKIKFRGKGHEVDDLNSMMQAVEHWAHRLYPKLSFDDIINKIEILGSKRAVQTYVNRIRLDLPVFEGKEVSSDENDGANDKEQTDELLQTSFAAEAFMDESPSDVAVIPRMSAAVTSLPVGDEFAVNTGGPDFRVEPAASLSDEVRARIQRNREAALQRRKALLPAASVPALTTEN